LLLPLPLLVLVLVLLVLLLLLLGLEGRRVSLPRVLLILLHKF
jgi:hypothetical protein